MLGRWMVRREDFATHQHSHVARLVSAGLLTEVASARRTRLFIAAEIIAVANGVDAAG